MNNKDLYYELTENGYHIYDKNDSLFHIYQYEPYIPQPTKSYAENAQAQIEELTAEPAHTLDEAVEMLVNEVSEVAY